MDNTARLGEERGRAGLVAGSEDGCLLEEEEHYKAITITLQPATPTKFEASRGGCVLHKEVVPVRARQTHLIISLPMIRVSPNPPNHCGTFHDTVPYLQYFQKGIKANSRSPRYCIF